MPCWISSSSNKPRDERTRDVRCSSFSSHSDWLRLFLYAKLHCAFIILSPVVLVDVATAFSFHCFIHHIGIRLLRGICLVDKRTKSDETCIWLSRHGSKFFNDWILQAFKRRVDRALESEASWMISLMSPHVRLRLLAKFVPVKAGALLKTPFTSLFCPPVWLVDVKVMNTASTNTLLRSEV